MIQEAFMDTGDLAGFLVGTLGSALDHPTICIEHIVLRSPSPVMGRKPLNTLDDIAAVVADATAKASDAAGADGDPTTGASDAVG
jgi:hypothetical protein